MSIVVTADLRQFEAQIRSLGARAPIAGSRALNRSIGTVQTAAVRAVAEDLKITQKDVRKAMALERSTPRNLFARLTVTGRRLALYAFRARPTLRGVSYDLGRGRKVLAGAFIATMRSTHVGVFKRRAKTRLPIDERFGPSLPHVFVARKIAEAREALAREALIKNLKHEIAFLVRAA